MSRRTVLGLCAIALSLILFFIVFPLFTGGGEKTVAVLQAKAGVERGAALDPSTVSVVQRRASEVPEDAVSDLKVLEGQFARVSIVPGALLQTSMLRGESHGAEDVLASLPEGRLAVSFTISSMAAGLSGKLMNGDVIALAIYEDDNVKMPMELSALRVITATTSGGVDADEVEADDSGKKPMPSTVTVLATEAQARLIVSAQEKGRIYVCLVSRGEGAR